ncbi:MAG: magnesium transporter [Archaeoglobi archaeon]|nr:magnesium transporter [Archaeoglobi archaeon]MDK2782047.1 magnesium transporter [Archaeoglobi archaeon]
MQLPKGLRKKVALPPSTPVFTGERKVEKPRIFSAIYDERGVEIKETAPEELRSLQNGKKLWVDVAGLHEEEMVREVCEFFAVHPLVTEDILNTAQRVKIEDYGDQLFVVMKVLAFDESLEADQLSIVIKQNVLLTFRERDYDFVRAIHQRLHKGGRIRNLGVDYLAYAVMDAVVDSYFVEMLKIAERMEALEDEVFVNPRSELIQEIHGLKRAILAFRNAVWPLRDVLSFFTRVEHDLISEEVKVYYRDCYDHAVRLIEVLETQRELAVSMRDVYLSSISNKLNEIMKVLTMIATIFIPLSFIAGVYGMNFDNMPELHWEYGYPAVLAAMALIALLEIAFFRRKGWL